MNYKNIQFVILFVWFAGRMAAVAQPSEGHYLHWNRARCGSPEELLALASDRAAPDSLSKARRAYLPLLGRPVYAAMAHPYLRDVYQLPPFSTAARVPWAGDSCVDFHEPLPTPVFCGLPDDPGLSGLLGSVQSELDFVRVPEAWERVPLPDPPAGAPPGPATGPAPGPLALPMRIGVVDTWADTAHPDLQGQFAVLRMNGSGPAHGTAVSGIAGARTNNGLGIASASRGAELAIQWMADVDGAVVTLAREGARVIAVPWINRCFYSPIQQALYDEARSYGALVVASAGNGSPSAGCGDGHALAYPASLRGVLSVSSVGHRYARGSVDPVLGPWHWRDVHDLFPLGDTSVTHTHNDSVDLVAPGHGLLTTVPGGGYAEAWGTSFSAPLVAGIASLVWSANPCLSAAEVATVLKETAYRVDTLPENAPYLGKLGSGRVDALAALEAARGADSLIVLAGEDGVWTGTRRIGRSLVLEPGARLTIRGRVFFGEGARVLLKPGSRLELDGAELLASCGGGWGGIRVLGNPALPHPPPGFLAGGAYPEEPGQHALLVVRPGTVIRDADTAVLSRHGGLVGGEGAQWIDNTIAFVMEDYGFPVQSYLRNCVFSWQDHEPPPGSSLTRLSQVQGFLFQGCSWISAFSTPGLRALEAADAGLTLREGTCPGSPCLIGPKGVIRGFDLGLEVWSAYGITPGPVYIAQTTFRACRRSLLLRGLDAAVLQSLDVEVPAAGGLAWPYATYGLHLEACRNTLVTASSFAGLGPLPLGVLAYAGDFYPAEISSCRFSGLRAALVVLGPNGNARSGLQLSCNRFSGNDADVWMAPGDAAPSMARYQSDCVYQPAGNRFSAEAAGLNWLLDPSAKHTWYFHHSGLDFTPSVSDSLLLRSVDCGRPYQAKDCPILPVLPLNQAADSIRILHTLAEQLEASMDNGSTEELLRLIAAPGVGAGVMQFALSEANPYLSDTVLLSLIHRYPDVTPWFFQFLLESNSPLSQPVLSAALAVLPASARDALLVFQGPAPNTRELLRARVASVRKRLQRWEARRFIAAWQADQRDSLLLFAEGDPDRLARLLSANQQWAALDRLMRSGGADTLARSPLLTLFLQLASEGRSLAELNTVELEQLENLAFQPGALGVSAALALRTYDGRVAQEPLPTEDPDPRQASLSFGERGLPSSASASQNQAVLRGVPGRYRIYPNPAGDQLLVQGVAGQESWQLLDANGTMRGSGQLPPGGVLSLRNLPPGLYALRIAADHTGSAQTLTFVKAP